MDTLLPNLGVGFIWAALLSCAASVVLYLRETRAASGRADGAVQPDRPGPNLPRALFTLASLCVLGAAVVHSTLLLTHRFDINYVYRFSARELPTFYLFATFWAGQEGSFLLWAFWTAVLGCVLARTLPQGAEQRAMAIYGCVLTFLLTLLAIKSPYALYHPESPLDPAAVPTDGVGLNPLLENPWMVVHPPTLFLGLSSLAAPFAIAASSLLWNARENWVRLVWPWALFGFSVLGFGIMLGGYWAYETLGWGGFWGWDPVEIGPFVPWMGLTAFLHSAQASQTRGSLKRTTALLAMLPFVLALYETFLTRTGILDKFSNHSFSTLGGVANSVILYGLLVVLAFALGLFAWRWRTIKDESNPLDNAVSRDFAMTIAVGLILLCAVISGVGMSAPLITQAGVGLHLLAAQSSVQPDFYNRANFPVACLILIGMAIGPYLEWRETSAEKIEPLGWLYCAAVVVSIVFVILSKTLIHAGSNVPELVMFACCSLCIFANGRILLRRLIGAGWSWPSLRASGGALAHIGAALLLFGVVFLVAWYRVDDQALVQGHSSQVDGIPMTLTYVGETSNLLDPTNKLKIAVLEGSSTQNQIAYTAYMPVAVRNVEGSKELVARPAIIHRWWGDLYFALKDGPEEISPTPLVRRTVTEGGQLSVAGYKIDVGNFSADPVAAAQARSGHMPDVFPVTVPLIVTSPTGDVREVDAQYINYFNNPLGNSSPEIRLPMGKDGIPWAVAVTDLNADTHTAHIYLRDSAIAPVTEYTIEVSTRPMVGMVWIGTVLITLGGFLAMRRRMLEAPAGASEPETPQTPDAAQPGGKRRIKSQNRPVTAFAAQAKGAGK